MRRADREVTNPEEICRILKKAEVLRIAMNDGAYPYILPVNFGFEMEGGKLCLYFHGSDQGSKHEIIRRDPHVSFEVDCGHMLIAPQGKEPCTASYAYESVIGRGLAERAEEAEKGRLLRLIAEHYGIPAETFHPGYFASTVVYKIIVEHYTAKRRPVKP